MTTTSLIMIVGVAIIAAVHDFSLMKKGGAKLRDKIVYGVVILLAIVMGFIYIQDIYQPSITERLFTLLGIKG